MRCGGPAAVAFARKWADPRAPRHDRAVSFEAPVARPPEQSRPDEEEVASSRAGEVRFVTRDEAIRLRGALEAARLLWVSLAEVGPGARGRLAETLDDAIELALRHRGGAPPGIGASSDPDAALSDQLYRVRKIGRLGLAIELGPLSALVDARRSLDPEDAAALRFFAGATRDRPVVLLMDTANLEVRAYGAPQPLADALGLSPQPRAPAQPAPRDSRDSRDSRELRDDAPKAAEPKLSPASPPRVYVSIERAEDAPSAKALSEAATRLAEITRATPLSALERAFVEAYVPLRTALLDERLGTSGVSRSEARARCTAFATTFSRAYAEALPTFGVTGRHPRMIFELFDLAQRCARVHGARSTHVVLVDALRWDLGKRLRERLSRALARQAVCVEEHALWSILPTTTSIQLDALVRGEDALRAPVRPERETAIVRRSLDVLRRMRLGHRDVVKLDLVEGKLRDAGAAEGTRLDALADEIAPIVGKYVASSKPRALVVVAGDHGFSFGDPDEPRDERAPTPPARQGGASPDEVFVPFQAWLVGGVH